MDGTRGKWSRRLCLYCKSPIPSIRPESTDRRLGRKYCNAKCRGARLRVDSSKRYCIGCNTELVRRYNEGSKRWGERKFCKLKCRIGPLSANWKGGRTVKDGYVHVTENGIRDKEHRMIAQRALGRKLKPNEIVHHVDCDGTTNRNNKLLICDRGYHKWLHDEMGRRYAQEHLSVRSFIDSARLLY